MGTSLTCDPALPFGKDDKILARMMVILTMTDIGTHVSLCLN